MLVVAQNRDLSARRSDCLRWALDAANGTFRFDEASGSGVGRCHARFNLAQIFHI